MRRQLGAMEFKASSIFGTNTSIINCSYVVQENDRLRTVAASCEQRLIVAEQEMEKLRTNLANYETTLNNYRGDSQTQVEQLHEVTEQLKVGPWRFAHLTLRLEIWQSLSPVVHLV